MSRLRRCRFGLPARTLPVFVLLLVANIAGAQGVTARAGLDLAPTNPFGVPGTTAGLPQGSNSLYLNSCMFKDMLPLKGNLEFGYLYQFNENISTSRFTFDGLLPARAGADGAAFGEVHGEFVNFGNILRSLIALGNTTTSERGVNDRIDLSIGGGYRKIFGESLLLGLNGFYDTSKLGTRWYSSPGVGVEMAVLGAGCDLIDLNFNYYGNLFQGPNSIVNAFRNGPGNFDVEVGYSLELGAYGPDLRLKLTGYQFDVGSKIYGWNGGAEVTTRNGMFSVKAEAGRDKINGTYYTLGGYANVGLQLENVLKGESPFTAPEPIFQSPRNLRRVLTQKVKRNWHQPASVILSRSTYTPPCSASLPGYLITTNSIQTPAASLSGRVPQITTLYATLCWCDVISDASIFIEIYAPNGEFDQLAPFPLPLSAPTGCATVQLLFYSNLPSPGYLVIAPGSSIPVLFAPGGGISIQFNQ